MNLQISYHNGKPMAAYLYLQPRPIKSARSKQVEAGLVIDAGSTIFVERIANRRDVYE